MIRPAVFVVLLISSLAASHLAIAGDDCAQAAATPLIRYAAYPPQLGGGEDTATRVEVDLNGCVSVHFPARSKYAGRHVFRLGASELVDLTTQIDSWQLGRISAQQLRVSLDQSMRQRAAGKRAFTITAVRDEPIVRFELGEQGKATTSLTYPSIQQDWANHPHVVEVRALHDAKESMTSLIVRAVPQISGETP